VRRGNKEIVEMIENREAVSKRGGAANEVRGGNGGVTRGREAGSGGAGEGAVMEEEACEDMADLVTQMTMRNEEVKRELECPVCLEETHLDHSVY
jgi:hypothetical protein